MGVEIEKKYLIKELPKDLHRYAFHVIEQGYLNVFPAIRVRREDDTYYMTYKGDITDPEDEKAISNMTGDREDKPACDEEKKIGKTEYNLPLDKASYEHMVLKADGNIIRKKRYLIPLNKDAYAEEYLKRRPEIIKMIEDGEIKIELDVFEDAFEGRIIAEIEFPDEESARNYDPAEWFDTEVTGDRRYSNAFMSTLKL